MHPVMTKSKGKMSAEEKAYQAEWDLKTLIEAEKIKKDKSRLSAAMKAHAEQMKSLQSIEKDSK